MMENLGGETSEAEMSILSETTEDINDTTLVPNQIEDNNITPSEMANEIEPLASIIAYRRPDIIQFIIDSESIRENECNQHFRELGLLKEKYKIILSQRDKLQEAKMELHKKMANLEILENNIKQVQAECDKIELMENVFKENLENQSQIKIEKKTKQIFQEVKSVFEGNDGKTLQIKNNLGSRENKIADQGTLVKNEIVDFSRKSPMASEMDSIPKAGDAGNNIYDHIKIFRDPFKNNKLKWNTSFLIVKKNNGIAWYISLKNKPGGACSTDEFLLEEFEIHQEIHEGLMAPDKVLAESSKEVKEFWPEQKIKFEKEFENGEKHDEITEKEIEKHDLKDKKDLTLINNNLKTMNDLSVTNEATELVLMKKEEVLAKSFKEEGEFWPEQKIQPVEASENGEKNDEIIEKATKKPELEVKKDIPLVANNLKATLELSLVNEVPNPSLKPNQDELVLKKKDDIEDLFKLMDNLKLSD